MDALEAELKAAREREAATAEVLQVINSSPGDLAPVWDAMLEKAASMCEASLGFLCRYDGEAQILLASRGASPELVEMARRVPIEPESSVGRLARGKDEYIHTPDITDDPVYRCGVPSRRLFAEATGARTALWVALRKDDALIGVFILYRTEVRPFTDKQIAFLRNFAQQAVIAMENVRLLTETREALEAQQATAEVMQVINAASGDLAPVFQAMLDKAVRLCEAHTGHLFRFENRAFFRLASRGVSEDFDELFPPDTPVPLNPNSGPARMIATRSVVHVRDVRKDESYWLHRCRDEVAAVEAGILTVLFVPLIKEGEVVGHFTMHRREVKPFSDKQIALLQNFAAQAVIAMDNARLLDEIRHRQAELRVTFDNMGDGVAMFDADMRLAAWNRNFQKIIDLPDEFVAQRPTMAGYVDYLAARGEYVSAEFAAEIRRGSEDARHETRFERTRPDGMVIEVRRNAVPGGGSVLIYSDITERKRAEAEIHAARDAAEKALGELQAAQASLVQAQKMAALGQLTAGIAHEIKNPLNFVNNFASLSTELLGELKEEVAPALDALDGCKREAIDETIEMLTGNLDKIAEHGQRADNIVKSMLEHARGVSGERRPVDLNALVEEALNLAYHGARAQDQSFNVTLERDYAPALAPIELAPQEMTRVFLNLIGNGFYATNKRAKANGGAAYRPTLCVATCEREGGVEVRVRDNGTGIPADLRDKLFQPFFTTKPTGEGTGLGLSISYDIVTQQHGGTIVVDSEVDAFTEFTIRLPRNAPTMRTSP
ncbi:MAG TPA: PAS-domain containing protein [Stellaceae bacterium]|nr:PAS-domain containing protein [Stellaceae bacterium]